MLYALFILTFLLLWGLLYAALPAVMRGLSAVARKAAALSMRRGFVKRPFFKQWLTRASAWRDYLPVLVIVVGGIVLISWAGDEFLDLAELVRAKSSTLKQVDDSVHDWAVEKRNEDATGFFDAMSKIGGPAGVVVIAALTIVALFFFHHWRRIGYLSGTIGGGGALDWELKRYFARARPDITQQMMHAHGYSFPSGHAMGSTILFAALAYLVLRLHLRWRWRAAAIALAFTLIASVALSRVYLGVHWISDVGAGIVCGFLWVTVTTVAYETFRRIHGIRLLRQERLKSSIRDGTRGE